MLKDRYFFAVLLGAMTAIASPVRADFDSSKVWFLSLDVAVRSNIQRELVLVGDYNALIDGGFGPSTFAALEAFQKSNGDAPTGALDAVELGALGTASTAISDGFGLEKTEDGAAHLEILVPTKLLPARAPSDGGTTYSSPSGDFELKTMRLPAADAGAFGVLFQSKSQSTPARTVSYAHLGPASFTVTGSSNGRFFYDRFYFSGGEATGFTLTWASGAGNRGTVLASYLATYSSPLAKGIVAHDPGIDAAPVTASTSGNAELPPHGNTEVAVQADSGTFVVPVLINNELSLNFTLDSGAADVSVPADVVHTLERTGTLTDSDFTGTQTFTTADGRQMPSQTFRIRSLKVGDKILENVDADVAPAEGDLLLGQSFLSRFSSWSMDNNRGVLVLGQVLPRGAGDETSSGHGVSAQ